MKLFGVVLLLAVFTFLLLDTGLPAEASADPSTLPDVEVLALSGALVAAAVALAVHRRRS
ncbi:hypothetical protein ACVDFE_00600 [Lentzea chajnantorensis]